jgi:DNA-binding beta-propeller fold protein YncE
VLATRIDVGSSPSAIAVTPDAGLALVGTAGSPGLQALTLAEYETADDLPDIGAQPTEVAVSADGKTVIGWHDAQQTFKPGKPSTGLFVYDVVSETVVPQLATTAVVDFAYAPTTPNTAFVVNKTQAVVEIVSTESWTVTSTIDLKGQTTGLPAALAPSADGSTLFALTLDDNEKCELVAFTAAHGSYSPAGTVTVIAAGTPGSALTLAAAPDGSAAYITDEVSGNLFVIKRTGSSYALSGQPVPVGTLPIAAALSPDGSALYVTSTGMTNGSLAAIDTATLAVRSVVLPPNSFTSLAGLTVSPDGTRVLATDPVTAGVRIFDAESLRLVQSIPWTTGVEMPNGIAASPDGSRIFTANTNSANLGVIAQVQADASLARRAPLVAAEVVVDEEAALVGDDTYQGLFLRDYVGQTPQSGNQTGSWTDCPDIWAAGQSMLTDPQTSLVGGYGSDSPNIVYTSGPGVNNYIYVRGANATNGANTSRVWLYYVDGDGQSSLMTWPPSWLNGGIQALQTGKPYIEVPSTALNEVDYTYPPFIWNAVPVDGHYCIIAWIENPPLSQPAVDPRQGIGSIGTYDQLAGFIASHPNMGWKNTVDKPTTTGETWEEVLSFEGPPRGGLFRGGLQFTNMPTDAFFSFTIAGPTPATSVNVPKTQITSPNETYLVPVNWTGVNDFKTQMVVTYYSGGTPMAQGANIQVAAALGVSALVGIVDDPLAGAIRARVHPAHDGQNGFQEEWLTIVGQVKINTPPA